MVRPCINAAMYISNTFIGYKISFYPYKYKLCLSNTTCINYLRYHNMKNLSISNNKLAIVNTLKY